MESDVIPELDPNKAGPPSADYRDDAATERKAREGNLAGERKGLGERGRNSKEARVQAYCADPLNLLRFSASAGARRLALGTTPLDNAALVLSLSSSPHRRPRRNSDSSSRTASAEIVYWPVPA